MRYGLLLFALVTPAVAQTMPTVTHAVPHRYLDEVPGANRYPWVVGRDWPRNTLIRLTVRYKGMSRRTTLRTGGDGPFGVDIAGTRLCTGLTIGAVDATGYRVVLHGVNVFRTCPSVTEGVHVVFRRSTAE
ncbi:MAG: hypothetical protein NVSMB22_27400 [Chloroflexota bacterium]